MMRLAVLGKQRGLAQKLRFAAMRLLIGQVPGPFVALSYRSSFVGRDLARCYEEGLREAQEWSVGEIETFAAFVSSLNQCSF